MANPYEGTEMAGAWAMGFTWGFVGPAFSQEPPSVIAPDSIEVFNEGVLAGQEAAINGLPLEPACVSLAVEAPSGPEALMGGIHILETAGIGKALILLHLANAACEALVMAFLFMIPGPPPLSASQSFNSIGKSVKDELESLGLAVGSLYVGAGVDEAEEGCELLFTPVFRDLESAQNAVAALERSHWMIAEWDTELPVSGGGFRVIEAGGE